jgi:hypothetical protein
MLDSLDGESACCKTSTYTQHSTSLERHSNPRPPAFDWAKTVHAFNSAATVIGNTLPLATELWEIFFFHLSLPDTKQSKMKWADTLQNSNQVSVSGNVSSMHIRYEKAVSCNNVSRRTFMQPSFAYCGFANCGFQIYVVLHIHLVSSTAVSGLMYPRCLTLSTDGRNRWSRKRTSTAAPRSNRAPKLHNNSVKGTI